jgi:hypothetical protein
MKISSAIKSRWEIQKEELKARFTKLTDEDLNFEETRKNEMFGKLALKLGITTRELEVIINRSN